MEGSPSGMEWQSTFPKTCRSPHRDRRLSKRLGAYCQGISTGGPWCLEEKRLHINCLELLAGSFAIQTFTKDKVCAHVRLLMDNTAAVAYINKMGGTHSHVLSNLAVQLWEWCLQNNLEISAQHLPGHLNVRADQESRMLLDSSDWKLDPLMFQSLQEKWGPLEIDLFASRLTHQLPKFVSWRPDPLAVHSDAFSMNWRDIQGYAFPPLCSDRALSTAGKDTECGTTSSGGPSVASTDLVPTITTSVRRSSSVIPNITQTGDERQSVSPSG